MINPKSRSLEWITEAAQNMGVRDIALAEKTIRAFSLLENPEEYKLLQDGISRIGSFIHSEKYTLDSAIINAAKVAYLSKLLSKGINEIRHYSQDNLSELATQVIQLPLPTKLNKLKKTHPEAFFYWNEIQLID